MASNQGIGTDPTSPLGDEKKVVMDNMARQDSSSFNGGAQTGEQQPADDVGGRQRRPWHRALVDSFKTPGSAIQIIVAAALAITIGMVVTTQVETVPKAVVDLVMIPGDLWLRALRAVVMPLIITAMILAIVRLREMTGNGAVLARWTVGYYVLTTLIAIVHTCILVDLVWRRLMTEVSGSALDLSDSLSKTVAERKQFEPHVVVVEMFRSFITNNIFYSLANDGLLAILIAACVVGYLLDPMGSIMKAVEEIEKLVTKIITFLIKIAPIGVFFLILPNLFRLNIAEIGQNLGVLIGSALAGMFLHLFILIPIIYVCVVRENPYPVWFASAPAWLTAWGTASSAATLPVTLRETRARGVPNTVAKFSIPLGCLINMDGTAIYFPCCVVFLAQTQGIVLDATKYVIIVLLATLASIGTTPIPSASLVLTVMIAQSVDVPITGMYGVIIAIDWFVDRFRTATNVSADIFAAKIVTKITGIKDAEDESSSDDDAVRAPDYSPPAGPPQDNANRV
ncbi:hypothetical protein RB595_006788 [Gaeumannomyces hyphopodioides]